MNNPQCYKFWDCGSIREAPFFPINSPNTTCNDMAIGETSKALPKSDIKARERTNITFERKKRLTLPYSKSKMNFAATKSYNIGS